MPNPVLGPLALNLLGLEGRLDRGVLVLEADPTAGLLGQRRCGIANLLNGGSLGNAPTNRLNQWLGLFPSADRRAEHNRVLGAAVVAAPFSRVRTLPRARPSHKGPYLRQSQKRLKTSAG